MAESWLSGPVTTYAFGWRLERRDGITLGFTSHDEDVLIDGLVYHASPGLVPSSVSERAGIEATAIDINGALTSDAISSDDLHAGKWDGATIEAFLFDWTNLAAEIRFLANGKLGAILFTDDSFSAEVEGPAANLSMPVAPFTSPTCRARFCDAHCGLNPQRFRQRAMATRLAGGEVAVFGITTADLPKYVRGELRWLGGANGGIRHAIIATTPTGLTLDRPPHFAVQEPQAIELLEGCDKLLASCGSRFGNIVNFRGEPQLPGNDLLTRFPGG